MDIQIGTRGLAALRSSIVVAGAVTALALLPPAYAQTTTSGLELTIIDAGTALPIIGAQIVLPRLAAATTDSSGVARFERLNPVAVEVEIRALGYDGRTLTLDLPTGQTFNLTVPLDPSPVLLPGVRVDAAAREIRSRDLREFYNRVQVGTGRYITREDIQRRQIRDIDDLFRTVPGFAILTTPAGNKPILDSKSTVSAELFEPSPDCPIQYFLDGSPMTPIHDGVLSSEISLNEVEGIEIYRRGSTVPAKFHRLNNTCGVVLIWKRESL